MMDLTRCIALALAALFLVPSVAALDQARLDGRVEALYEVAWDDATGTRHKGVDGTGVALFLAEGFDMTHPDLASCGDADHHVLMAPTNDTDDSIPVPVPKNDYFAHGDLIAGIVCGSGAMSDGVLHGVATGATLYSVDGVGHGDLSAWFEEPQLRIFTHSIVDDPVWRAGMYGMRPDKDILFFQGVGNTGNDPGGQSAASEGILHSDSRILGVGAADAYRRGVTDISSRGDPDDPTTWPDLLAPNCLYSINPLSTNVDYQLASMFTYFAASTAEVCNHPPLETHLERQVRGYVLEGGTSLAAPFAAAVGALALQVDPALTYAELAYLLTRTADPFLPTNDTDGDGYITPEEFYWEHGWEAGWGLVNATAAVAAAHYHLLHPGESLQTAVACSSIGPDGDGDLMLNPPGAECREWLLAPQLRYEPLENGTVLVPPPPVMAPETTPDPGPSQDTPLGILAVLAAVALALARRRW